VDEKGPHAVESGDALGAPLPVCREEHLGVASRGESPAERLELAPQLEKIVDLAVEHHHVAAVIADHRLVAGAADVEDRQAPKHQTDSRGLVDTDIIRTAMRQHRAHAIERSPIDRGSGGTDDAGESAHQ
jgi:hypothetical protein